MPKKPTRIQVRPIHSKQFVMDWLGGHPDISRRALCRKAGLDESTLTKAFSVALVAKQFDGATLKALAKAMKVSVAEIIGPAVSSTAEADTAAMAEDFDEIVTPAGTLRENFGLLPHRLLIPNPENPRIEIDAAADDALMQSIASIGIQQPLVVRPLGTPQAPDDHAMIIGGHRRWRQVGRLIEAGDWSADYPLPVYFTQADGRAAMRAALAENMHRVGLTPLEEGQAFLLLRGEEDEADGWSVAEIAVKIGRTTQHVEARIALITKLCDHAKAWLRDGTLNFTRARILCQFDHAEQMLLLRAMDNNDRALVDGNDDEFRARAKYLVELHRNGGVHTKPVEVHRIAEGERDETLGFDHQPEKQREQHPPTGDQDNTRFVPPATPQPDPATVAAATQAFDADDEGGDAAPDDTGDAGAEAEANTSVTSSVREDLNGLQAGYNAWLDRLYAFEDAMRQAAANRPEIGYRLLMLSILNCLEVSDLGRGQHCLPGRACFSGLEFDSDPDNADWPLAMAQPRYTAGLWREVGAASYQPAITMALASLIDLPGDWENYRGGVDRQTLGFWQAVAMDLGIAWPDDLYTTASGAGDGAKADQEAA